MQSKPNMKLNDFKDSGKSYFIILPEVSLDSVWLLKLQQLHQHSKNQTDSMYKIRIVYITASKTLLCLLFLTRT